MVRRATQGTRLKGSANASADLHNPIYDLIGALDKIKAVNPARRPSPQETTSNLFKVAVYRYVREWIRSDRTRRIKSFCGNRDDGRKTIKFEHNQFNWVLTALREVGVFGFDLTPSKINSIGWQLLHAHRHNIEPDLLVGFLYQTSASSALKQKEIKKPGNVFYEPWFKVRSGS